ncbi:MAG: hypothetical protein RIS94_1822 [Pseudomonadota bacterium]|jgi:general secretion pathway protein L
MDVSRACDDVIALAPAEPGGVWAWWWIMDGAAGAMEQGDLPPLGPQARLTLLVPAALAPVRDSALPDLPVVQALAAARLSASPVPFEEGPVHVAVAACDGRLLQTRIAALHMDQWLAALAAIPGAPDPVALVPAALVLPRPAEGATVLGELAGQKLARVADAAFAAEDTLLAALAGPEPALLVHGAELERLLAGIHKSPPLNLRQGPYGPRRVSFFRLEDWRGLARMAGCAALLALAVMLVSIQRWHRAADAQEQAVVAQAAARFPSVTDFDSAERVVMVEAARRGAGPNGFAAQVAALLDALRAVPGLSLRDLGYAADGTLRFTAAAPRPDDINAALVALQRAGWKVTVPPAIAPDPTGATVAAITLRAP